MIRYGRLAVLVAIYLVVAYLIPPPAPVTPQAWRLVAIFIAVIAGQMLQPIHSAAVVILGLAAMVANGTPMREALGGYAEPSVWLVLVAMIMARVLMETGAAHRIALFFVRQFGHRSIGVSYALVLTDVTLAAGVPSITARSGGMVMPVGKAIAELFDSRPGPTRGAAWAVSVRSDVSGISGGVRHVPDRPGQQPPRGGAGAETGQRRGDLEQLVRGRASFRASSRVRSCRGLFIAWSRPRSPRRRRQASSHVTNLSARAR